MDQMKAVLVVAILCTSGLSAADVNVCKAWWKYLSHTRTCLKFFRHWSSFSDASNRCAEESQGTKPGHLVYIFDNITDNFVKELLRESSESHAFIGLNDRTTRGKYVWGKNNPQQMASDGYTGWKDGEPSTSTYNRHVVITRNGWEKRYTQDRSYYICQMQAELPQPKLTCPAPQEEGKKSSDITCTLPDLDLTRLSSVTITKSQTPMVSCDSQLNCRASEGYHTPPTLDTTLDIKLSLNILSVSRADGATWTCSYGITGYPDTVSATCDLEVYAVPETPTCGYSFTPEQELEVTCTSSKVYPKGKCWWKYYIDGVHKYAKADIHPRNEEKYVGGELYYETTCVYTKSVNKGLYNFTIDVYPDMDGIYRDHSTAVKSSSVTISIEPPPGPPIIYVIDGSKKTQVSSIETSAGKTVIIECAVTGGTPPVRKTKLDCTKGIKDVNGQSEQTGDRQSVQMTIQVTRAMNGHSCECSAEHTTWYSRTSSVSVSVKYPAEVTDFDINNPEPRSDEEISFICSADGNPEPQLQLYRENHDGQRELIHKVSGKSVRHRIRIVCNMTGQYVCSASNTENVKPDEQTTGMKVKCPLEHCDATSENRSFAVPVNENVSISMCVLGYPKPTTLTLYKGSSPTKIPVNFTYTDESSARGEIVVTVQDLKKEMLGDYRLYNKDANTGVSSYLKFSLMAETTSSSSDDDSSSVIVPVVVAILAIIIIVAVVVIGVFLFRRKRSSKSQLERPVKMKKDKGKKGNKDNQSAKVSKYGNGDLVYANVERQAGQAQASSDGAIYNNQDNTTRDEVTYSNSAGVSGKTADENVYSNQASPSDAKANKADSKAESQKASGRTVNEEGLVYVTVEINKKTTNPEIMEKKKASPKPKRPDFEAVEYMSIDHAATKRQSQAEVGDQE